MQAGQLQLDFQRGEQLSILRNSIFPLTMQTNRGGVSGVLLKAVLKAIDDHGRVCFAGQDTLAREVGCSVPHLRRAIQALQALSVICVTRRLRPSGVVGNEYRIVWSELALLVPSAGSPSTPARIHVPHSAGRPSTPGRMVSGPSADRPSTADRSVMEPLEERPSTPDQSVMVAKRSVMVTKRSVMGDTCIRKRLEPITEATSPPTPSRTWTEAEGAVVQELDHWEKPVQAAMARVDPDYVLEVIDHYRASGGAYGPGALYGRLLRSHPEMPPTEGWPRLGTPSPSCERAIELLSEARRHPRSGEMTEATFRQLFRAALDRQGLGEYWAESLFRELHGSKRKSCKHA